MFTFEPNWGIVKIFHKLFYVSDYSMSFNRMLQNITFFLRTVGWWPLPFADMSTEGRFFVTKHKKLKIGIFSYFCWLFNIFKKKSYYFWSQEYKKYCVPLLWFQNWFIYQKEDFDWFQGNGGFLKQKKKVETERKRCADR